MASKKSAAQKANLELTQDLISEVVSGVQKTFSTMFGLEPKMGPTRHEHACKIHSDISGIVHLIQEQEEGIFIVSFPKSTIFAMLSKIYNKPFSQIDSSVEMGVGELTNIIYGTVKAKLNNSGMKLKMAIPNVILGQNHTILSVGTKVPTLVMPFQTPEGEFHILLTIYSQDVKSRSA